MMQYSFPLAPPLNLSNVACDLVPIRKEDQCNLVEKKRKVRSGKERPHQEFIFHLKMENETKKRRKKNPVTTTINSKEIISNSSQPTSSTTVTTTKTNISITDPSKVTTTTTTTTTTISTVSHSPNDNSHVKKDKSLASMIFKMYNLPPKKAYSLSNKHFSQNMKDLTISPSNSLAGEQIPKCKKVNLPPTTTKSSLPLPIKENSIKSLLLPI